MIENTIQHNKSEPALELRERINKLLIEKFGVDTVTGLPMWRVAWAPDQYNKRRGTFRDFTEGGIFIREVTEVREVPKYPHLRGLYILELLQGIPTINEKDLPTARISYECIHPYMHAIHNTYLPPHWIFTEWVIDCYYAAIGQSSLHKYIAQDPEDDGNNGLQAKKERVDELYRYLYGNETSTTDALAYGTGVFMDSRNQLDDKSH